MLCLKAFLGTKKTLNFLMSWQGDTAVSVLHLKARCWLGDGCEQDRRMCVLIDQQGTKPAVSFFSLPSPTLLCFFPFSWGFYSWKTKVKHWHLQGRYWKLGMAEEQNMALLACWVLGFCSLGYSVTPGLAWWGLFGFFLCYFARNSPPMAGGFTCSSLGRAGSEWEPCGLSSLRMIHHWTHAHHISKYLDFPWLALF